MSLFWRVFTANAALLTAATVVLGVSPVTVSWPIVVTEAVVPGLGLVGSWPPPCDRPPARASSTRTSSANTRFRAACY